jgi:hypothetical protein
MISECHHYQNVFSQPHGLWRHKAIIAPRNPYHVFLCSFVDDVEQTLAILKLTLCNLYQ